MLENDVSRHASRTPGPTASVIPASGEYGIVRLAPAEQADMLAVLLPGFHHDVGNALGNIRLLAECADDLGPDAAARITGLTGLRSARLVNTLIDVVSGERELSPDIFDICDLVSLFRMLRSSARRFDAPVGFEVAENVVPDPDHRAVDASDRDRGAVDTPDRLPAIRSGLIVDLLRVASALIVRSRTKSPLRFVLSTEETNSGNGRPEYGVSICATTDAGGVAIRKTAGKISENHVKLTQNNRGIVVF